VVEGSRLSRPGSATGCWPCTTRVDRPRPSADDPGVVPSTRPAEDVLFSSVGTDLAEADAQGLRRQMVLRQDLCRPMEEWRCAWHLMGRFILVPA